MHLTSEKSSEGRFFILGAGASFAAGFPLADRVVTWLYTYCCGIPFLPGRIRNGTPKHLMRPAISKLQRLMLGGETSKHADRFPLDVILEQFHREALANPAVGQTELEAFYHGLVEMMYCLSVRGVPGYLEFAKQLRPRDIVLTFNWDVCLEITLTLLGLPFQRDLGPHQPDRPRILKIHGSIDYMSFETEVIGDGRAARPFPEVVEPLAAKLPAVWGNRGISISELVRLQTYDLGQRVDVKWDIEHKELSLSLYALERSVLDANDIDLGALQLRHLLGAQARGVRPLTFVIAPGTPAHLARWSYDAIRTTIKSLKGMCDEVYVVGYSFPQYDAAAIEVIEEASGHFGRPGVHVIDPFAKNIRQETLSRIFSSVTLHECGFQDFAWSTARADSAG